MLPEPKFYTIKTLAQRWNCIEEQVLNYVMTGQLKASVLTKRWWLEKGYFEEFDGRHVGRIPDNFYQSYDEILDLTLFSTREVLEGVEDCDFQFEASKGEYLQFSSRHYPSDKHPRGMVLTTSDLVFRQKYIRNFENQFHKNNNEQFKNVEIKRLTLKQLELDMSPDAMPLWHDYYQKHQREPSRIQTAKMLQSHYPSKYAHHNVNSIIRHLKLGKLKADFIRFRASESKEGKRISF